ncbi:MAG: Long-chain fatty acid--CoA ligase [uncultured Sulfurovum sp.]|uniref:Long-chain-fatty-acid--CoA ligase n=1 Tax=uncultured Sulfurovum sp. TaxID=269237 RepID=A0A6S6T6J1_9BACT|nr:MAG: Long-chain fatty acid--CoA ligase [uncultured Sulfurovum sp.]
MNYAFNNFYDLILTQAKKMGKKTAIFIGDEKRSYQDIQERADILAAYLANKGVKQGDKVALFLRNSAEFVYAVFAVSKLGAISVPINTFLKEEELAYILEDSSAKVLLSSVIHDKVVSSSEVQAQLSLTIWEGGYLKSNPNNIAFEEALSCSEKVEQVEVDMDTLAVIIYTSGTTGKPKGAMLSFRNMFSNAHGGALHVDASSADKIVVFLPMFHSFTFTIGVIMPLYLGASSVVVQSLKPFANIFKQVLLKRVTIFLGIPDVYNALVKAKLPWYFMWFNNIRIFVSGAAALQPKTLVAMQSKFKSATLLEGYGLSEASPAVSINPIVQQKAKSVGTALHGYEIKIVDDNLVELARGEVGDIIVKGDNVMMGYLNRPTATDETIINGWLLTGDMGSMDEDDFLYIVDRKKDLVISKGINIYPRELEEVIDAFSGVSSSAVIGLVDEKSGEIPVAYIELEEGIDSINELALKKYLRDKLANYKVPKQIYFIDELPKNATGKVLKRKLKENIA